MPDDFSGAAPPPETWWLKGRRAVIPGNPPANAKAYEGFTAVHHEKSLKPKREGS